MAKDTAATPFSSSDGKPIAPTPTKQDNAAPKDPIRFAPQQSFDISARPNTSAQPWLNPRPQTTEDGDPPNPAEIPAGGKILKADPGKFSQTQGAQVLGSEHKPYKGMR